MSVKQVIVIRRDLKMRRGKEIAQGAHASMAFLVRRFDRDESIKTPEERMWLDGAHAKVCVQVHSEAELIALHEKAVAAGLESHVVTDLGRTEFGGIPTKTALAIGPARDEQIDPITRHLQLY